MCAGAQTFPAHLDHHRAPLAEASGNVGVRTDKASRTARLVFCIQTIEGTLMNRFERFTGYRGFSALLVALAFLAGCGSGDEILGGRGGSGGGGPGPAGAAPNLGAAATFGIAATAGVTNTPTAPRSQINGDAVLDDPGTTCNGDLSTPPVALAFAEVLLRQSPAL